MRVALDVMGGDFGPVETVKGAVLAVEDNKKVEVILVGKENEIKTELEKYSYDEKRVKIVHADEVIENKEESVALAVKKKKNSSMNIALELVSRNEADACVSSGNTGALVSASLFKLKRLKGVLRPAITTILPTMKGYCVLLDAGATADSKPEFINQYSIMGTLYAEILMNKVKPSVALINIGSEKGKGNEVTQQAYEMLEKNEQINFKGNIEPRDLMDGDIDIAVTDGFTGNIILKTSEGVAKFVMRQIKKGIKDSTLAKLGFPFFIPMTKGLKKTLDYSEYGGALILGVNGISIKAHGSSDSNGIKNAVLVGNKFSEKDLIDKLSNSFGDVEENN